MLAALIAAVVSVPVSFLLLRLTGGYFAVASLVIASVFQVVATLSPSVGGSTGVTIPGLAGYGPLLREAMIYWAALAIVVMSIIDVYLLVRGRFGLDARAAGNEPVAAASLGVRTGAVRRVAYLTAAAGALAAAATLLLPRGIWGFVSHRWGWSVLPIGYAVLPAGHDITVASPDDGLL